MTQSLTITYAKTPWRRMKGLLGKRGLATGEGLLILPCNAIHTLGMHFNIDVRFFDRRGNLVQTIANIPPGKWWIWGGWKAHSVLETAAGDTLFEHITHLTDLTQEV